MPKVSELQSTPALAPGDLVYVVADGVSSKLASLRVANIAAMQAILVPTNGMSVEVTEAGRGGLFVFDTSLTALANLGTTFKATDATTGSWARRYSGPINVRWFNATADGVTNDTLAIQAAIDAAIAGGNSMLFPAGTYIVSKNGALTGFNSDQPCLLVRNASNMTISGHGATLQVNTHAQGILEIVSSSRIDVEGLILRGAGNFPPLDGATGRGEKGYAGEGYQTTGFQGYYKNNSYDTSADNRGGFGGAFPQWGGGTTATWGVWNGGYIGNVAYGLLVNNDCEDITVRRVDSRLFNRAGISVGHLGNFWPVDLTYPDSRNIKFIECVCRENYDNGIETQAVEGFALIDCDLSDNGHPSRNAATNTYADPGYGLTSRATIYSQAKSGVVTGNRVIGNGRKGLDVHAGKDITISNNICQDNPVGGIYVDWQATPASESSGIIINGNILENNGFGPGSLFQIYLGGAGTSDSAVRCIISNNVFKRSGTGGIRCRYASNVSIVNNVFRGSVASRDATQAFIDCFPNDGASAYDSGLLVQGNNVFDNDGFITIGIRVLYEYRDALVSNNLVRLLNATATNGIMLFESEGVSAWGNKAVLGAAGTPLSLSQTDGHVYGNYGSGGSLPNALIPITRGSVRPPDCAAFTVNFTGAQPTITNNSAPDIVTAIVSTTNGFEVTLSGLANYAEMSASVRATWFIRSSQGIDFGAGGTAPFLYTRGLSHSAFELGMKTTPVGTDLAATSATSGSIDVVIFLA